MSIYPVTALYQLHKEYGAKFAPHEKWQLAESFPGGSQAEIRHTEKGCCIFDRSHCGLFRFYGENIGTLLSDVYTGNMNEAPQINCGLLKIPDLPELEVKLLTMSPADYLMLLDTAALPEVKTFLLTHFGEAHFQDLTDILARQVIYGKAAKTVLTGPFALTELPETGCWQKLVVAEVNAITLCTAEDKEYQLIFDADYAEGMWEEFCDTPEVKPSGFAAYEKLHSTAEL